MHHFVILLFIMGMIMPASAQFQSIDDINIDATEFKKVESVNSDVFVLELLFSNQGTSSSQILSNLVFLVDSHGREFSSTPYLDLRDKGHDVSSQDCPFTFSIDVNPGLSTTERLCYEIPKDFGKKLSVKLYQFLPELCEEPLFECSVKMFSLEVTSQEKQTESRIPDWVKNTMKWYIEGQISEQELINALQFLIKERILKV